MTNKPQSAGAFGATGDAISDKQVSTAWQVCDA